MLQKYDTLKSSLLLAFAAAGGITLAPSAFANAACDISDGYGATLASYVAEAEACLEAAESVRPDFADELIARMNRDREQAGLKPLARRGSLDKAALAHALDMATRDYADHEDLEGRDHLYRIRAFDRSMLTSNTGANVLISEGGADAGDIYVSMLEDDLNNENLVRETFTHVGVGVAQIGGTSYVVQLFATMDGELRQALPLTLSGTVPVRAKLSDQHSQTVGWDLSDPMTGAIMAKGKTGRVRASRLEQASEAALNIIVAARTDVMVLRGPLVTGQ